MFYIAASVIIALLIFVASQSAEKRRKTSALLKYANADPVLKEDIVRQVIRLGMPEQQVIDSWGTPSRRTLRQLKTKTKTTLYFGSRTRVYLDDGWVVGWHQPTGTRKS